MHLQMETVYTALQDSQRNDSQRSDSQSAKAVERSLTIADGVGGLDAPGDAVMPPWSAQA